MSVASENGRPSQFSISLAPSSKILRQLQRLRTPVDYFAETRSSVDLWPEKVLCFPRKTQQEVAAEPLTRNHHHRYVLVIPWEGRGEVHIDDRRFALSPGQMLLIFPFQFHLPSRFERNPFLWQFVTFELRQGACLTPLQVEPLRCLGKLDTPLLSEFLRSWNEPPTGEMELAHWLGLILGRMLRAPMQPGKQPRKTVPEGDASSSLLLRINQECRTVLHEPFGLKTLASKLSISESHLRARFRRETGISLGQHLRRLRLQKAMSLLLQSDLPITEIAERCGFDSIFAFSRSFRQFTELSPRAYRQCHGAPEGASHRNR